jgi:TonB family protein
MSAARAPVLEKTRERVFPRHPINVTLDLIALRSGVPDNVPGRCTDISEAGVGAVVAGELASGLQVAVELRLPNVGVPVRARALVRYQSRLRCGFEFVGLSVEQREMIRYWIYRSASEPVEFRDFTKDVKKEEIDKPHEPAGAAVAIGQLPAKPGHRIRIGQGGFYALFACMLALAGLGWWQWQRSWNELEARATVAESGLRVSPETMEKRILTKVEPVYPEAARKARLQGLVVMDAVIAPDGTVKRLRPVSGPDLLAQSATAAVQSWKFEPYLSSGKPVEVETTIAIEFQLN